MKNKRMILISGVISIIYVAVMSFVSRNVFTPLVPNVGYENIAYTYFKTGTSMQNDYLSVAFCKAFAYFFAFLFVFCALNWLCFLSKAFVENKKARFFIIVLLLINVITVIFASLYYPQPIHYSPDTYYNFVYAKAWMPMYWHGFLTNVFYCAELLLFTTPLGMEIVPALFYVNIVCFLLYRMLKGRGIKGFLFGIIYVAFLTLQPETIQIGIFAGRNYMYGIVNLFFIGLILLDDYERNELTLKRAFELGVLAAIIGTWRSEGIFWLAGYPLLLFFVYFFREKERSKKLFLGAIGIFVVCYIAFSIPSKYGEAKYQEKDYFIINLPGPLASVLHAERANLTYDGYEDDLKKIDAVVPIEFINLYGEDASTLYNYECGRNSRQLNSGEAGDEFVKAAYNVLLHNIPIYFKYQINQYLKSIYLPVLFKDVEYIPTGTHTEKMDLQGQQIMSTYYEAGYDNVFLYYKERYLRTEVNRIVSLLFSSQYAIAKYVKLLMTFIAICLWIHSIVKRRLDYFVAFSMVLGILAVIIMTIPTARNNYFFYPYFNIYWVTFFYMLSISRDRKVPATK